MTTTGQVQVFPMCMVRNYQWVRGLLLCLLVLSAAGAARHQFLLPCYGDNLAVYITVPENNKGTAILFVPAPGYMDHRGFSGGGIHHQDRQNVFGACAGAFLQNGFITIQFDKPGTGASSGRLTGQEELALYCVFASLDSLDVGFSGEYFLVSIAGGAAFVEYALPSMVAKTKGNFPAGFVHLAGITNWSDAPLGSQVPVLSVVGDTGGLSAKILQRDLEANHVKDSLSRVLIPPDADANLYYKPAVLNDAVYRFPDELFPSLITWMQHALQEYRSTISQKKKAYNKKKSSKVSKKKKKFRKKPDGEVKKKTAKKGTAKKKKWKFRRKKDTRTGPPSSKKKWKKLYKGKKAGVPADSAQSAPPSPAPPDTGSAVEK